MHAGGVSPPPNSFESPQRGAFQTTLPLFISTGGVLFFGEHFSLVQALGGALILAGSFQTVAGIRWRRASVATGN